MLQDYDCEIVETNYTENGQKRYVIEWFGEPLDEFVYGSKQDAIDAAELL